MWSWGRFFLILGGGPFFWPHSDEDEPEEPSYSDLYLPILKSVVAVLEAKQKKPRLVERVASEAQHEAD